MLIQSHSPRVLAIEQGFHGKNFQSVLKVGEARGVAVLAAQMAGLEIREYSPALIKKAATGNGNADKKQVQRMMGRVLGLEADLEPVDITDALAAAFCHGQRLWKVGAVGGTSARRIGLHVSETWPGQRLWEQVHRAVTVFVEQLSAGQQPVVPPGAGLLR